jgi:hypothetical protein
MVIDVFDKTALTLWNNMPRHTRNDHFLKFCKELVYLYLSFPLFCSVYQVVISLFGYLLCCYACILFSCIVHLHLFYYVKRLE